MKRAETTAYRAVYEDLRQKIVAGDYPAGTKLPSKRQTAADYGISIITAEHAYALLCDEGYAEARERSGFYSSYREKDRFPVGERRTSPPPAVSRGELEFPYSVYAKTVRRVLSDYEGILYEKSPAGGLPLLRSVLAEYLGRSRGIRTSPANIILGSGSEYLYTVLPILLGRERIWAVEKPSYGQILRIYRAAGLICEELPLGENGIDSASLENSRAGVLHITPYRSYPSMVTATASKRHEYLRWARQRDGWLVEDDVESEFAPHVRPTETLFSLDGSRVLYMNSFSKTLFPSLRAAYMVLPDPLLPVWEERIGFLSCPVPVLEQCVLAELIGGGDFERHLNRTRRRRAEGK